MIWLFGVHSQWRDTFVWPRYWTWGNLDPPSSDAKDFVDPPKESGWGMECLEGGGVGGQEGERTRISM